MTVLKGTLNKVLLRAATRSMVQTLEDTGKGEVAGRGDLREHTAPR